MLIRRLSLFENHRQLVDACKDLIVRIPFKDHVNQIALQVKDPNIVDWYESCGSVYKNGAHNPLLESVYTHTNPELKGTVIEEWLTSFSVPLHRARLMLMKGKTCYSIHRDLTPRIHIPLVTNDSCYMCFPRLGVMESMPATGESYWVDTTKEHTFMNCSNEDRIHLVASARMKFTD